MNNYKFEITEEQAEQFERKEKQARIESIIAIRDKFQARYNVAEENYNSAGDGRSYSAMLRNEQLIDICELALQSLREGCPHCARKERNAAANRIKLRQMRENGIELDFNAVMDLLYI